MENVDIKNILEKHVKWINGECGGKRADLCGMDLRGTNLHEVILCEANLSKADLNRADLHGADLHKADLYGANLCRADLYVADLCGANLCKADLHGADLRGANLHGANLYKTDLHGADLCGADLGGADLREANLYGVDLWNTNLQKADLREANLYRANLSGINLREANLPSELVAQFFPLACPESGAFIGWKKALSIVDDSVYQEVIIKLKILEDAKRSSAFGRKCRCNKAVVLAIESLDGDNSMFDCAVSFYNIDFYYHVGETVSVDNFDTDRAHECAQGIHFFITRQEAVEYDP